MLSKDFFGKAGKNQPKDYPYKTDDFRGDINTQEFIDWAINQLNEHGLLQQGVRFQFLDSVNWWQRCYLSCYPKPLIQKLKEPINEQLKKTHIEVYWRALYQAPDLDFAKKLFTVSLIDTLLIREGKRGNEKEHMRMRKLFNLSFEVYAGKISIPNWITEYGKRKLNPCRPNSQ